MGREIRYIAYVGGVREEGAEVEIFGPKKITEGFMICDLMEDEMCRA
jgi:hypothetical protein